MIYDIDVFKDLECDNIDYIKRKGAEFAPLYTRAFEMPFIGTSEPQDSPDIVARDFIERGRGGYFEVLTNLAKLGVTVQHGKRKEEIDAAIKEISGIEFGKTKEEMEEAYGRASEILLTSDLVDKSDLNGFLISLNKIKEAASRSSRSFSRLAGEQNRAVLHLQKSSDLLNGSYTEDEMSVVAKKWGWSKEIEEEFKYSLSDLSKDLSLIVQGRRPSNLNGLSECCLSLDKINATKKNKKEPASLELQILEKATKKHGGELKPISEAENKLLTSSAGILNPKDTTLKYDTLRKAHDEAAMWARRITKETFYKKGAKRYNLSDSVPLVMIDQNGKYYTAFSQKSGGIPRAQAEDPAIAAEKKAHFTSMTLDAIERLRKIPEFQSMARKYEGFESIIVNKLQNKIFSSNPDQNILGAIYNADMMFSEIEYDISPSRRQEEQIGKIIEDSIYNEIMRANGGAEAFSKTADGAKAGFQKDDDVVDVYNNVTNQLYYAGKSSPYFRAFEEAKQVSAVNHLIKRMSAGEVSQNDFISELNSKSISIINDDDKQSLQKSLDKYYTKSSADFDETAYGMSKDSGQKLMDTNSYMYQRDGQYMHHLLFEASPTSKLLNAFGMEQRRGKEFLNCLTSAKHATIRTHSSGHETKSCIQNLIKEYEQDAKDVVQHIANPLMAMGGISGLMLIFSVLEKAQARRLKHLNFMMEVERQKKMEYVDQANGPKEGLAYMNAVKLHEENIVSTIVDKSVLDTTIHEHMWAEHQYSIQMNEYLPDGVEQSIKEASSQEDKAEKAHAHIMEVLEVTGTREEFVAFLKDDQKALVVDYQRKEKLIYDEYMVLAKKFQKEQEEIGGREDIAPDSAPLFKNGVEHMRLKLESLKNGVFAETVGAEFFKSALHEANFFALENDESPSPLIVEEAKKYLNLTSDGGINQAIGLANNSIRATKETIGALEEELAKAEKKIGEVDQKIKTAELSSERVALNAEKIAAIDAVLQVKEALDNANVELNTQNRKIETLREIAKERAEIASEAQKYFDYSAKSFADSMEDYRSKIIPLMGVVNNPASDPIAVKNAKDEAEALRKKWVKTNPFAPSYMSFEVDKSVSADKQYNRHAFSNKFHGAISTPFYGKSFADAVGRFATQNSDSKVAKKIGKAAAAIRSVFAELTIQQVSAKEGITGKSALFMLSKENSELVKSLSGIKFNTIEQGDNKSVQLIMTNREHDSEWEKRVFPGYYSVHDVLKLAMSDEEFDNLVKNEFGKSKEDLLSKYNIGIMDAIGAKELELGREMTNDEVASFSLQDMIKSMDDKKLLMAMGVDITPFSGMTYQIRDRADELRRQILSEWKGISTELDVELKKMRSNIQGALVVISKEYGINVSEFSSIIDGKDDLYESKVHARVKIDVENALKNVVKNGKYDATFLQNSTARKNDTGAGLYIDEADSLENIKRTKFTYDRDSVLDGDFKPRETSPWDSKENKSGGQSGSPAPKA